MRKRTVSLADYVQHKAKNKEDKVVNSNSTVKPKKVFGILKQKKKKCKCYETDAKEIGVIFGDDKCPKTPDFIICGAGTTALPLAKTLTDANYRVLVMEAGLDQSNNAQVKQIFANDLFQVNDPASKPGALNNNIYNIWLDPNVTTQVGNPSSAGNAFSTTMSQCGRGVGGSGLHYFCTAVKPIPLVLDGTLPSGINVPDSVPYKVGTGAGTYSLSDAGGPQWDSSNILPICKSMETFIGVPNPQRGDTGPLFILQESTGDHCTLDALQSAMASAAQGLLGGDPSTTVVSDYNIVAPDTINCVASLQDFASLDFTIDPPIARSNSATAWANSEIVVPDGNGNLVGVNGRRLVILTDRQVLRVIKDNRKSKPNNFYAAGVEFLYNNQLYFVKGKRVISAMNGVHSPLFWQRSGFGSETLLNKVGIPMQVNLPYMGLNLHNQYGPTVLLSTTSERLQNAFGGQGFFKYNGVDRRIQCLQLSTILSNIGTLLQQPYPVQITDVAPGCTGTIESYYCPDCSGPTGCNDPTGCTGCDNPIGCTGCFRYTVGFTTFQLFSRSRGYAQITQANWGIQPDVHYGFYNDGQGINPSVYNQVYETGGYPEGYNPSNDPSSGLFDQNGCFNPDYDSDIAVSCSALDYVYDMVYNPVYGFRVLDPRADVKILYPPVEVFQIEDKSSRWQKYVGYLQMINLSSSHEAGTVVMNNDPSKGCCDGNLKLHGTANCFEASIAVLPVQNAGNPSDLLMAMGINAAGLISSVPI